MNRILILRSLAIGFMFACLSVTSILAQTTAFNYQGSLSDGGNPASGSYLLQFELYDAAVGGNQVGVTISDVAVTAVRGVFTTQLDFGDAFDGTDRFLQISVKKLPGDAYTVLSPRQQINSSPYAVKSKVADQAANAAQLGGVNANEYVTNSSVNGSFINNNTTQQTANFNVSGIGIVGNSLGVGGIPQTGLQLDVTGNSVFRTANGNVNLGTPNSETGLTISSNSNRADFRFNGSTLKIVAGLGIGPASDFNGIAINTAGNVGIGTTTPSQKLDVFGGMRTLFNGSTQIISQTTGGTNSWSRFYMRTPNRSWFIGTSQNFNDDQFYLFDETSGQSRMTIQPNGGAIVFPFGNIGIGTSTPTVKLEVVGTMKTNILQISGGSDLAENFEFAEVVIPGMVVAIDPQNAGKLIISRGTYNRRVAGIVSGANNLSAGMLLPNLNENNNSSPVALSGRVWVYADATKNPIKPGDLLTTSETPGYAMKVTKHKKAKGAIIGKAMTGLESGKGLILVLVSLQ